MNTTYNYFYLGLPLNFNQTLLNQIQKMSLKEINDFIKMHTEINDLTFAIVSNKKSKDK
ncbi:hypothetical protein HpDR51_30920 [Helicobacter pylori]